MALLLPALAAGWTPDLSRAMPAPNWSLRHGPCAATMSEPRKPLSADERAALRLPDDVPAAEPNDARDPLGSGNEAEELLEQAQFRAKRRAAQNEDLPVATTMPLVALVVQCVFGGALCAGLLYSWLVRSDAAAGEEWAVEALAHSDEWLGGAVSLAFGPEPPGGPLCLLYAGLNGANALRCAPLLFSTLLTRSGGEAKRDDAP